MNSSRNCVRLEQRCASGVAVTSEKMFTRAKPEPDDIRVTYLITSRLEPAEAALRLCKEQSFATNDARLSRRAAAYSAKYLPGSIRRRSKTRFTVDVVFPSASYDSSLGMLLNVLGGDTFNVRDFHPIKILSVALPDSFLEKQAGPVHGVEGLRHLLACRRRPLLLAVVKPNTGLSALEFAHRAREALAGGADIVKDDELLCNPVYSPLKLRVRVVSRAVRKAEDETGEKKLYFAFIGSGSPSETMKLAETASRNGASGFMVAPAINGFEIIRDLRERFGLPVIVHSAFAYAACSPSHGVSYSVFAFFQRLVGADAVLVQARNSSFDVLSREEYAESISACLKGIPGIRQSFPSLTGGQTPLTIASLRKDVGSNDFIVAVGSAIFDHPKGPRAGASALKKTLCVGE